MLGAVGLVEVGDSAADVGRVPIRDVGLVGPKVEERDVARAIWPRVVQEELGELVELEVDVEDIALALGHKKGACIRRR